jgi:cellulose biosynthesis protein BcsQ
MITLALFNVKGGVGKTAAAVNLSYLSSREGRNTLLWDLDPQGSTTFYYQCKPRIKGGMKKLVKGKNSLDHFTKSTDFQNLDLLPSDFSSRKLDIILDSMKKPKKRLKYLLSQLSDVYDIIFLDSPTGFSLLSDNIFQAADYLLIPLIPTTLSLRTYLRINKYFEDRSLDLNKLIPFFSLVDRRKKVHSETVEAYRNQENIFLNSYIPYSSDVEKMGIRCAPLMVFSQKSRAAEAFRTLWLEIRQRTGVTE